MPLLSKNLYKKSLWLEEFGYSDTFRFWVNLAVHCTVYSNSKYCLIAHANPCLEVERCGGGGSYPGMGGAVLSA